MRKLLLVPAIAIATSLFLSANAQAQPLGPFPPGPGGPGPGPRPFFRPLFPPPPPPPFGLRPPPLIGIRAPGVDIAIGGPILRTPTVIIDPVYDRYSVVYRDNAREPWRTYRVYESRRMAIDAADQLRDRGYRARVLQE